MTVEPRISVKELFLAARELDQAARGAFLREKCGPDQGLRRRVEALLRAETAMGSQMLAPAPSGVELHDEIDRYELLDVLGEGGFGAVYRARRRGGVETEVALKVLRVGGAGADSAEALARFGLERQAMEAMDHPGIARVLDAGKTRAGRPFIVMELVRGEPITAFCDRERLTVAERTALMAEVCRAVQHAHHKGVIHRDLKPGNILAWRTEGRNFAKVIDFGVAKPRAGTGTGSITLTGRSGPIGTLAYMSPEQVRGEGPQRARVDTRADVYALGAVLYEVLCGTAVLEPELLAGASPAELERLICDVVPVPPSAAAAGEGIAGAAAARRTTPSRLVRSLRGELDWIAMRALEKEPGRRYATADALAADLEAHLGGGDVLAAPPSRWYGLRRTVRRNRAWFAAAAVAGTSMVGATAWSMRETRRARDAEAEAVRLGGLADEQRRAAEGQKVVAEAVSNFLTKHLLTAARPQIAGGAERSKELTVREVLDHAERQIREASGPGGYLHGRLEVQAELYVVIAETYFGLGQVEPQKKAAEAALAALAEAGIGDHALSVRARNKLAAALDAMGRFVEAQAMMEENVRSAIRLTGPESIATAVAERQLGAHLYNRNGDRERVLKLDRHAYEVFLRERGPDDPDTIFSGYLLGQMIAAYGDAPAGEAFLMKVLSSALRVLGPTHPTTLWVKHSLARVVLSLGGREPDAIRLFREVIDGRMEMDGPDHPDTLQAMEELGNLHLRARRLEPAREILLAVYEGRKRVNGEDHARTIQQESAYGEVLARMGDYDRAMPLLLDAEARMNRVHGDEMDHSYWVHWRVKAAKQAREQGSWDGIEG